MTHHQSSPFQARAHKRQRTLGEQYRSVCDYGEVNCGIPKLTMHLSSNDDACLPLFQPSIQEAMPPLAVPSPANQLVAGTADYQLDSAAKLVAQEMAALSAHDREQVYFDVHGVNERTTAESPEFLQMKLQELTMELSKLLLSPDQFSLEYQMALAQDKDYVQNPDFCLRFLRTDFFDAKKAAVRLCKHFKEKLKLFGVSNLVSDITQDILDKDTIEAIYSGYSQFLPLRDRAGRLVKVVFPDPAHTPHEAKLKRMFYYSMANSQDLETQRNGQVSIVYAIHQRPAKGMDVRNVLSEAMMVEALPIRLEAIHFCHDNPLWLPVVGAIKIGMGIYERLRLREHSPVPPPGSSVHAECMLRLQSFGIPTQAADQCFPLTEDGLRISSKVHEEMWEMQRNHERKLQQERCHIQQEQSHYQRQRQVEGGSVTNLTRSTGGARVQVPGRNDVLLGRGKGSYLHLGNIRFRHMIESRAEEYNSAGATRNKMGITAAIVQEVRNLTGRFLKHDGKTGWIDVDDEMARQKVAHAFRTLRALKGSTSSKNVMDSVISSSRSCESSSESSLTGNEESTMLDTSPDGAFAQ